MAKGKIKESRILGGWKKKQWFKILAPKSFGEKEVGETPAFNPEKIVGRDVSVNMMTLTGNIKKQNMNAILEINKVVGNKAYTFVRRYEAIPAYIKRMVRREKDRLDETIKCTDSNKKEVIIKLLLITSHLTKGTQLKMIRKSAKQALIEEANKRPFADLITDIISARLQKSISANLKKITPMRLVEVKKAELIKEKVAYGKEVKEEQKVFAEGEEGAKEEPKPKKEKKPVEKTEESKEEKPAPKKKPAKKKEEPEEEAPAKESAE